MSAAFTRIARAAHAERARLTDRAIANASRAVIASGQESRFRYIVEEDGEVFGVPGWVYEEQFREEQCLAVVWSYVDTEDGGKLKAACEREGFDW